MATPHTAVPKVERVEVHAARPEAADLRKIQHHAQSRRTSLPEVTLVYKIYLRDPPAPSSRALELFVGDHKVRKYSEFSGGLFFTINDPELAERLAGATIRLHLEGPDPVIDSGIPVPPVETVRDMMKGATARAAHGAALPSQRELLRS